MGGYIKGGGYASVFIFHNLETASNDLIVQWQKTCTRYKSMTARVSDSCLISCIMYNKTLLNVSEYRINKGIDSIKKAYCIATIGLILTQTI